MIWYKLIYEGHHRNVVGFFGYIILPEGFGLVSEYFSGGNAMLYSDGAAPARRVSLVSDVTCIVSFNHLNLNHDAVP